MTDITISKTDLASRDKTITEQAARIKKLEQDAKNNSNAGSVSASFNKEDQEMLGDLADPISKMINEAMQGVSAELSPTLTSITESMTALKSQVENQNINLFSGVASTTLQNYDKVKTTEEFKSLLEKRVPGTNITYGDSWADAEKRNSLSEMQEIVNMVEVESEEETTESPANFEPSGSSSEEESPNMGTKFLFKASDLQVKTKEYNAGQMTHEEYDAFEEKFNKAVDEGQVLNDLDDLETT